MGSGANTKRGWAILALAAALGASAVAAPRGDAVAGPSGLALRSVGEFRAPVYIDQPRDKKSRLLFVVEQAGTIRVIRRGRVLRRPFLDIRNRVGLDESDSEAGLLSMAFHPRYRRNGRFFVDYVNREGFIEIDQFVRRSRSEVRARQPSRRVVIGIARPNLPYHYGGQLQFGPDGFLYLSTGDGGGAGDPYEQAQDPGSLLGKLLRIEPKRSGGYRSPGSNPYADEPGRDEIYSLGLRNPWRFSFDRRTGDVSIGDVGQASYEEIDHETLASARGANFGWDNLEGNHPFEAPFIPPARYRAPIHEYPHAGAPCSSNAITGGYVVRSPKLPALEGRYLYGDLCAGDIRSLDPDAPQPSATDASTGLQVPMLSSFGDGIKGRMYVASLEGPVYRILAP